MQLNPVRSVWHRMVESSVKTISRPVIDRLPVNVNQIDEFACKQLDRVRFFPIFLPSSLLVVVIVRALPPPLIPYVVMRPHFPVSFSKSLLSLSLSLFFPRWFVNAPATRQISSVPPRASNPRRPLLHPPWPSPHVHPHTHQAEIGADQN